MEAVNFLSRHMSGITEQNGDCHATEAGSTITSVLAGLIGKAVHALLPFVHVIVNKYFEFANAGDGLRRYCF